eukprot:jgi/Hompol1/781/HPOL_005411-RA
MLSSAIIAFLVASNAASAAVIGADAATGFPNMYAKPVKIDGSVQKSNIHVSRINRIVYNKNLAKRQTSPPSTDPSPADFNVPVLTASGNQTWAMFQAVCSNNRTVSFAMGALTYAAAYNTTQIQTYVAQRSEDLCIEATGGNVTSVQSLPPPSSGPSKRSGVILPDPNGQGRSRGVQSWAWLNGWPNAIRYDMIFTFDYYGNSLMDVRLGQVFSPYPDCAKLVNGPPQWDVNMNVLVLESTSSYRPPPKPCNVPEYPAFCGVQLNWKLYSTMWFNDEKLKSYPRWYEEYDFDTSVGFDGIFFNYQTCVTGGVKNGTMVGHGCDTGSWPPCKGGIYN